jgi:hypothetical protein
MPALPLRLELQLKIGDFESSSRVPCAVGRRAEILFLSAFNPGQAAKQKRERRSLSALFEVKGSAKAYLPPPFAPFVIAPPVVAGAAPPVVVVVAGAVPPVVAGAVVVVVVDGVVVAGVVVVVVDEAPPLSSELPQPTTNRANVAAARLAIKIFFIVKHLSKSLVFHQNALEAASAGTHP